MSGNPLPPALVIFDDHRQLPEGAAADIVIFDPEKVEDRATFVNPISTRRVLSIFGTNVDPAFRTATVRERGGRTTLSLKTL